MKLINALPLTVREQQKNNKNLDKTCKKPQCVAEHLAMEELSVYCHSNAVPTAAVLHILLRAGHAYADHMSALLDQKFESLEFKNYFCRHIAPFTVLLRNTQDWASERGSLLEEMEGYFFRGIQKSEISEPSFLQSAVNYSRSFSLSQIKKENVMEEN